MVIALTANEKKVVLIVGAILFCSLLYPFYEFAFGRQVSEKEYIAVITAIANGRTLALELDERKLSTRAWFRASSKYSIMPEVREKIGQSIFVIE